MDSNNPYKSFDVRVFLISVLAAIMITNLALIFFWAPTEMVMGLVQKVLYVHVPLAWIGFLAFFVVFIGSVMYLWKKAQPWDGLAQAAAEVGVLCTTLMLVTGAIWAKPVWGVWWTWDPRLTTSTILWLMYVGYLMLRGYAPSREQGARYAAVMGIVAFVNVPIVYYSTILWRTVHPEMVIGPASETGNLDSQMRTVLLFSALTFTLLFVYLVKERLALTCAYDRILSIRHKEGIY